MRDEGFAERLAKTNASPRFKCLQKAAFFLQLAGISQGCKGRIVQD